MQNIFFFSSEGEKRLKRDLIRTRALLRDAEIVIQKNQGTEASKAQIKSLRNKVNTVKQLVFVPKITVKSNEIYQVSSD